MTPHGQPETNPLHPPVGQAAAPDPVPTSGVGERGPLAMGRIVTNGQEVLPMPANAPARLLPSLPPYGTFRTPTGKISGFWALPRPLTSHWGQGQELMNRIGALWGDPDVIFGKQDTVGGLTVDADPATEPSVVADWSAMPFEDGQFAFGYWDPPYLGRIGDDGDVHYDRMDPCLREICRVLSERLVVLSPLIYPCPRGWVREAVLACTYGPNKVIRAVQSFVRTGQGALFGEEWRSDPFADGFSDDGVRPIKPESSVIEPISPEHAPHHPVLVPRAGHPALGGNPRIDQIGDGNGPMPDSKRGHGGNVGEATA